MAATQLAERQINLRQIFSPEQLLLSNGYEVDTKQPKPTILVDEQDADELEILYNSLALEKSRNELRRFVYFDTDIVSHPNNQLLIATNSFTRDKSKFDNTLEWFTGELMVRQFAAFSAGRSIKVKNVLRNSTGNEAGDYDAIAVLRNTRLAYFECKSGGYDYISVGKCYERMISLNCQFSIFITQQEIIEENIIWLSESLRLPALPMHHLYRFSIRNNSTETIYEFNNCYLMDMSGNFENKIRTILRVNEAKRNVIHFEIGPGDEMYRAMGYNIETVHRQLYPPPDTKAF